MPNLMPTNGYHFSSGKVYNHSVGLSCCFRQWRAATSHCRFLHGYALKVELEFRRNSTSGELDDRNWVMNFGGLKEVKAYLEDTFDHKTLIARDDPQMPYFTQLSGLTDVSHNLPGLKAPIIQLRVVDHVGCEAFAKMIFEAVQAIIPITVRIMSCKVSEHEGNWAKYEETP